LNYKVEWNSSTWNAGFCLGDDAQATTAAVAAAEEEDEEGEEENERATEMAVAS